MRLSIDSSNDVKAWISNFYTQVLTVSNSLKIFYFQKIILTLWNNGRFVYPTSPPLIKFVQNLFLTWSKPARWGVWWGSKASCRSSFGWLRHWRWGLLQIASWGRTGGTWSSSPWPGCSLRATPPVVLYFIRIYNNIKLITIDSSKLWYE